MRKFTPLLLAVQIIAATVAAHGQGLVELKRMWRTERYDAILRPLLDLRVTQPSFEIDYMLGTALCKVPEFSSDGYAFLNTLLEAYQPPFLFDGRPVDIREAQRRYCPPPGVTEAASPIAGAGTRVIELHRPATPAAIAKSVRSKLKAAASLPRDILGTYNMVHDGWRGTLLLDELGGKYTDSTGKSSPVQIASVVGNHIVFHIIGLGGENADGSGGQRFDAYVMAQSRNALAGTTTWQGATFGFYAIKL